MFPVAFITVEFSCSRPICSPIYHYTIDLNMEKMSYFLCNLIVSGNWVLLCFLDSISSVLSVFYNSNILLSKLSPWTSCACIQNINSVFVNVSSDTLSNSLNGNMKLCLGRGKTWLTIHTNKDLQFWWIQSINFGPVEMSYSLCLKRKQYIAKVCHWEMFCT